MPSPRHSDIWMDLSSTMTIVLAGGRGTRLHELTTRECKPALHFAGHRRLIDFTMANAVRSGLDRMIVATQYRPQTLERYLPDAWGHAFAEGGLELSHGPTLTRSEHGYTGTASAVMANADRLDAAGAKEVLVLSADHIYEMDYRDMIAAHRISGAAVTVAASNVDARHASAFGVIKADLDARITSFVEKPDTVSGVSDDPGGVLISMGIYVFDWDWLKAVLAEDAADNRSTNDFGHDILPRAVQDGRAYVYRRPVDAKGNAPYWRDVGTLDAYRMAHLDFMRGTPPCTLPTPELVDSPDGTSTRRAESLAFSMSLGGMQLRAPKLGSEIGQRWTVLDETVVLPGARVATGARLARCIVAPGTTVPEGLVVGEDPEEDAHWFRRTPGGTTLITTSMLARRSADRSSLFSVARDPGVPRPWRLH